MTFPRFVLMSILASLIILPALASESVEPLQIPWTEREHPGHPEVDAWGWHAAIWYQQTYLSGVPYEYVRDRVIGESYHWGANLVEVYPSRFYPHGWPWTWEPDDDLPKPDAYKHQPDPDWSNDTFRALTRLAHRHGMLVQWFCHPELIPKGGYAATFDHPEKIDENLTALKALGDMFFDASEMEWQSIVDGWGHEHWFVDNHGLTERTQWHYNPGQYTYSTHNWHSEHEPTYIGSMMCAAHTLLRGRDDRYGFPGEIGKRYLGYQADSRTYKPPAEIWGGPIIFGGGTWPDWIVEQANDYFRRRLLADHGPEATGIWWLGETDPVFPYEFRPYVYAASGDPMRCAVAGPLRTTGREGHLDMMQQLHKLGDSFKPRSNAPATGHFLQNNFLRLEMAPARGVYILRYDPTHTGNYDINGPARDIEISDPAVCGISRPVPVWERVAQLRSDGDPVSYRDTFAQLSDDTFRPFAPPSGKKDNSPHGDPSFLHLIGDFKQGNYRVDIKTSEAAGRSYYRVQLDDRFIGAFVSQAGGSVSIPFDVIQPGERELVLESVNGNDARRLSIALMRNQADEQVVSVMRVIEPAGHLAVMEQRISSFSRSSSGTVSTDERTIRYEITADQPRIVMKDSQTRDAIGILSMVEDEVTFKRVQTQPSPLSVQVITGLDGGLVLEAAKSQQPHVQLLRLEDADGRPYYVREAGASGKQWWTYRGAQPSREHPGTDLLRVYHRPGHNVKIMRDGFIEEIAKPGWGCQYLLSLADLEFEANTASATAAVLAKTPMVFAPRIEFTRPIASATIDGQPWSYFSGPILFLPLDVAEYEVEAQLGEAADHPRLTRTQAPIKQCEWDESTKQLRIGLALPEWPNRKPEDRWFAATIDSGEYKLSPEQADLVLREGKQGINLKLAAESVSLQFSR